MTAGGPSRNRAGGPAFLRGLLCFILGLAFGSPPAAACSSQGRIGCVSLRRGAQCAPARVGRPACIRFENRHDVEAKSALPRNALAGIPRPLPCFSSPNGTRWAGLPFGAACGGSFLVQLENGHKCFGGQLYGTQGPHFLFACPNGPRPVWVPGNDFNARAK